MGQEQSLPQDTNEPNNKNNSPNLTINNIVETNSDKNGKENVDNKDVSTDKSGESNSEIKNPKLFNSLSNSNLNDNYKDPMKSMNSLLKSYKSSKDFFSLNLIESLMNFSSDTKQASFDLNIIINFIGAEMASNNFSTKNFIRLVLFIISELNQARTTEYKNEINLETRNALYILKLFTKYFIENLSSDNIKELFDNYEPSEIVQDTHTDDTGDDKNELILQINESVINDKKSNLESLIIELLNALIYLPLNNEKNIDFYEEILSSFIIYLVSRFHDDENNNDNILLTTTFDVLSEQENENLAGKVITKLLLNLMYVDDQQKEGLFARVLRINSNAYLSSISRKSLYIFLLLTNQRNQLAKNKLSNLVNELSNTQELSEKQNVEIGDLKISFQSLYTLIYE
ncbi:hypothetical protein PIROE2DRAFT_7403 [Piromyces sp. E2]|nr:hypothetical protein PIROE2DRAFT_7403 [Piromyces sp. E2]|eukprot:OUM65562.1 hypothetical protein PIROE2DRAFT_7403 [Piromyces sp. E2]